MQNLIANIFKASALPNLMGISTIDIADFYSLKGYIWRLTGSTGGAQKIKFTTPAYTTIGRIPLSSIYFDGSVTITLYEGGSATSGGSAATPLNAYRPGTYTSQMTCTTGVTYANDGTVLDTGAANNFKTPNLDLWYLKASTSYVLTFSGASNYMIQWAEVPV